MPGYAELMAILQNDPWYKALPAPVRTKVDKYPPALYKLGNEIVTIYSYTEEDDGTCKKCRVYIPQKYNPGVEPGRNYIGVKFTKLELIKLSSGEAVKNKVIC